MSFASGALAGIISRNRTNKLRRRMMTKRFPTCRRVLNKSCGKREHREVSASQVVKLRRIMRRYGFLQLLRPGLHHFKRSLKSNTKEIIGRIGQQLPAFFEEIIIPT